MLGRVTSVQADPERFDDAIRVYQETVADLKDQQGFVSAVLLLDRASGRGMSITVWESEESLNRTAASSQRAVKRAADVLQSQAQQAIYEVLQYRPGSGKSAARVTTGNVSPDWFYQSETQADTSIIDAASKQPGYCGFLVLGDQATKHVLGMSFWDSMEHLDQSEGGGGYYQKEMEKSRDQWEGGWKRDVYEVAAEI